MLTKVGGASSEVLTSPLFAATRGYAIAAANLTQPWDPSGACLVATPSCMLYSIAKRPDTPSLDEVPEDLEPMGPALSAPVRWRSLSGGRDGIYGLVEHEKDTLLDRVDADGKVTRFVEIPGLASLSARIIETATRTFLLLEDLEEARLRVVEIGSKDGKPVVALDDQISLPYALVLPRFPGAPLAAMRAREVEMRSPDSSAVWGPYRTFALLDDAGAPTDEWALAMVQVNPPPPEWPEGKAFHKKKGKAKNECGGKPSRPLSDKSVEKVIRLLRFRGAALASDRVLLVSNTYAHDLAPLAAAPKPGLAVEIDGVAYGPDDKKQKGGSGKKMPPRPWPAVTGLPFDHTAQGGEIADIAFDPAREEGVLVYGDGDSRWIVAFDAAGKPKGPPRQTGYAMGNVLHVGGEWVQATWGGVTWLTGEHAGKMVPHGQEALAVGWTSDGDRVHFFFDRRGELFLLSFDPSTNAFAAPVAVPYSAVGRRLGSKAVLIDEKPALVEVFERSARVVKLDGETRVLLDFAGRTPVGLASVPGDVVLVTQSSQDATAHWLLHEGRASVPRIDSFSLQNVAGWPNGSTRFGSTPGQVVSSPELAGALAQGCSGAIQVGPKAWVLGCVSPTDPLKPGRSVGLRTFVE